MVYSVTDSCAENSCGSLKSFIELNGSAVLFGAGKNGEFISHFLKYAGLPARCFIDSNPARVGHELNGLRIESPEVLRQGRYGIVITSELHADSILAQLQGMGVAREQVYVLRQREFQQLFDGDPDWPAYIVEHYFLDTYKKYFNTAGIDCSGRYLERGPYRFPNVFAQPMDYQISFFSEIVDYVLPAMCNDLSMLVEGPGEFGEVAISPGDIVFDCGANIGLFSLIAAARHANVYAFEPVPAVISHLEKAKEIYPDIRIIGHALSDRTGTARISLSNGANTGNSLVLPVKGSDSIEITTTSIDEFVALRNIDRVDFIKADIEGAERLMLAGAQDTLKRFAPKLSICTYHLADDKEVLEELVRRANPGYVVTHKWQKLYAHIPR